MSKKMRSISAILATLLILCFATTALAAVPENTIVIGDKAWDANLLFDPEFSQTILDAFMENGGNLNYVDFDNKIQDFLGEEVDASEWPEVTYTDVEGNQVRYEEGNGDPIVQDGELKVVEVSAITDTVFSGSDKEQKLEFTINNGEKVSLEKLEEQGYTVVFRTNEGADVLSKDNIIDNTKLINLNEFSYVIEISKEGMEPIYSEDKKVKVVDAKTVVEIKKAALEKEIVTREDKEVEVKISEWVQADGKEVVKEDKEDFISPKAAGWTVKSSERGILNPKSDGTLMVLNAGKAIISLEKKDMPTYSFEVEVHEDAPKATTAEADDIVISHAEGSKKVEVTVKDQYDQEIEETVYLHPVKMGDDAIVKVKEDNELVAVNEKSGTDTIYISTSKDPKDTDARIGSFKVTVEKAGIEVAQELELIGNTTLDVNEGAEDQELVVKLVGKDRNGVVTKYYPFEASAKPDNIVDITKQEEAGKTKTITIKPKKAGETIVTITSGEIEREVKVKVIDSTPAKILENENEVKEIEFNIDIPAKIDDATEDGKQEVKINKKVTLTQPVQLKSAKLNGIKVPEELIYDAASHTGKNFITGYVKEIEVNGTLTKKDLEDLGAKDVNKLVVTVENEAGIKSEFTVTINFVEKTESK